MLNDGVVVAPAGPLVGRLDQEAESSAVSWTAVMGGAFVAAALCLILLSLGTGLGLSAISPWSSSRTLATVGGAAIAWLIAMQVIAFGMGGYLAGRLRTKWTAVHSDEVFFRDTAHGFLVWAVSTAVTAAFLTTAATAMVGDGVRAGATTAQAAATVAASDRPDSAAAALNPNAYFVDALFRSDRPLEPSDAAVRAEAGRIFQVTVAHDALSASDKTYLGQLVAARTGVTQAQGEERAVNETTAARKAIADAATAAREAAETARKAAAHLTLWIFLALLVGAFTSSYSATIGGRQRDLVPVR